MFFEYFCLLIYIFISFIIGSFIYIISYNGIEQYIDNEKLSSYECGFEPFIEFLEPINIKYYIISILFIIFDVELLFLFPWIFIIIYMNFFGFFFMMIFLIFLSFIYIYEWFLGVLDW